MADESRVPCPNCSYSIKAESVFCKNCGYNIQTGESYRARLKKAKGARDRRPPVAGRIGWLMILAFGLVLIAGFVYQRRMIAVIRENEAEYRGYVQRLEQADAVAETEALIDDLRARLATVTEDRAKQSLLNNLISKAEHRAEQIRDRGDRDNWQVQ